MFKPDDILYEDNHLMVVNKHCGDLVQPDRETDDALETEIKAMIKVRDHKPGEVFLGVVHRIDRPVSGAVIFAKTSKALARLNEMIRDGAIRKTYWALTEAAPDPVEGRLTHYIVRDGRTNRSRALNAPCSTTASRAAARATRWWRWSFSQAATTRSAPSSRRSAARSRAI